LAKAGNMQDNKFRMDIFVMRLFVALELPDGIKEKLIQAQEGLPATMRKTGKDKMHLTLQFLGDVPQGRLEDVKAALEKAAGGSLHAAITVGRAGAFPSGKNAHVAWIGANGAEEIAKAVNGRLSEIGFMPDKPFAGHITIGRAKFGEKPNVEKWIAENEGKAFGQFETLEIALIESMMGDGPLRYAAIGKFPFKGANLRIVRE
jgi:RNA 2',3'-cyclic 3'-phosphodiesterase